MFHERHCNYSYPSDVNHSFVVLCNSGYMELLKDRIKRLRIKNELSQEGLGDACGVSRVAVTKWESGDTENIKLGNLIALAKALKVTVPELLAISEPAAVTHIKPASMTANEPGGQAYQPENMIFLSAEEHALINRYRAADADLRQSIQVVFSRLPAEANKGTKGRSPASSVVADDTESSIKKIRDKMTKPAKGSKTAI